MRNTETELKLRIAQADLGKAAAVLRRISGRAPKTKRLQATYYDTRTHRLFRAGYSLRLRREDNVYVETLKRGAEGDALVRGEWSARTQDDAAPFTKGKVRQRVRKLIGHDALKPQFNVDVDRKVFAVRARAGALIEAVLDSGRIHAGREPAQAIHEIELELITGTPEALYALALKLSGTLGLTLEPRSKAARGFEALGRTPAASRADAPVYRANQSLAEALRNAARRYFAQYIANMPAMLDGDVSSIHMMRVAVRRLRSAIAAAKKFLPAASAARVNADLKAIQQSLGDLRDLDVLTERLRHAPKLALRRTQRHRKLIDKMEERRARALVEARSAVLAPAQTRAWLRVMAWFESLQRSARRGSQTDATLRAAVPAILDRLFKQVRKRGRQFEKLSPDERHRLRIAGKKLRYGIELFESLYSEKDIARLIRPLKLAQDDLGAINDAHVARRLLAEASIPGDLALEAGESLGWIERNVMPRELRSERHVRKLRAAEKFW